MESETTKKVLCRGNVRVMEWITDNNGELDYERANSGTIVERFPRNGVEGKMRWE
jgi:hypothetical protein